jgi:ribonuclease HI
MPKTKFYAVHSGVNTGVFDSWKQCSENVIGVKGAKYKSFTKREDAERFISGNFEPPELESCENTLYFYTDGSHITNEKDSPAGWGFCCVMNDQLLFENCGRVKVNSQDNDFMGATISTNNTGELTAIGEVLKKIKLLKIKCNVVIRADSKYAINTIQGNYKITKNEELISFLQKLYNEVKLNTELKFEYIPAHSGYKWNHKADFLANYGRTKI